MSCASKIRLNPYGRVDWGHDRDKSDRWIVCMFSVNCHEVMGEMDEWPFEFVAICGEWQIRMEIGMKSDRPWMMAPAGRLIPNVITLIYLNFMCVPSVSYFSLGDTACQIWKTVDVLFNYDLYSRVSTFLRCLWRRTCKVNCFFCFIVEAVFQVCIDFRRTRIFTTVKWRGRNDSIVVAWSSGFYSFTITHLLWQMFFCSVLESFCSSCPLPVVSGLEILMQMS